MPPDERERVGAALRRKGSLAMMRSLDAWLSGLEQAVLPEGDLTFGGIVLMSAAELREVFLKQLKPWPLVRRIEETRKVVKRRLDKACERMREQLERMAADRLNALLSSMPDSPERRQRATRLLDSRDARLEEIAQRAKAYLKDFPGLFRPLSLLGIYRDYLEACEDASVQAVTLPLLEKKRVQIEDLPALCAVGQALYGLPREGIRHMVIDECQDFSPWQLALLRRQMPGASFTLVGDLMQGIHEEEGIRGYDEWVEPVFEGKAEVRELVGSYRSTVEIMDAASQVAMLHPVPGQKIARPVLRHGGGARLRRVSHRCPSPGRHCREGPGMAGRRLSHPGPDDQNRGGGQAAAQSPAGLPACQASPRRGLGLCRRRAGAARRHGQGAGIRLCRPVQCQRRAFPGRCFPCPCAVCHDDASAASFVHLCHGSAVSHAFLPGAEGWVTALAKAPPSCYHIP